METVYAISFLALRKSTEHLCVRKCHKSNENSCAKTLLVAMSGQPEKSEGTGEGEEKYNEITKHEEKNCNIYDLSPVKTCINVL